MSNDEILREFLLETHENLALLDSDLIRLEKHPDDSSTLAQVFRTLHSIKGTAGFMGLVKLQALAHSAESLLSRLRSGQLEFNQPIGTALLRVVDATREIISRIESTGSEGDGDYQNVSAELDRLRESGDAATKSKSEQSISSGSVLPSDTSVSERKWSRAPETSGMDFQVATPDDHSVKDVTASFGATTVSPGFSPDRSAQEAESFEAKSVLAERSIRVDVDLLDNLMTQVGELVLARNQILQYQGERDDSFQGALQKLNQLTTSLQSSVMKTRMQPVGVVLNKFPRVVRDLALACGKQVRFHLEGEETELDRSLLEAIRDPLTHLVRNAVDHGIELPAVRLAAGKPSEGQLRMLSYHEGGKVVIEITDDGSGINVERIREKAIANRLITSAAAERMSTRELMRLIFLPGFSTADRVSQFSGRGVGMDVVKTNIERIGGTVEIDSTVGLGTTIRTKIPLTLAIIPALIVDSGGERFVIPQSSLQELVRIDGRMQEIEWVQEVPVYRLRGKLLPLVFLAEQLQLATCSVKSDLFVVVVQVEGVSFGVIVEGIRDTEEIVIKPLQRQVGHVRTFAGAAIMGDGRVALVLDILGLAQHSGLISGVKNQAYRDVDRGDDESEEELPPILLFMSTRGDRMAIPLSQVERLEEFAPEHIESVGGQQVIQYRNSVLPLIDVAGLIERIQSVGIEPANRPLNTGTADTPMSSEPVHQNCLAIDRASGFQAIVYDDGESRVGLLVGRVLEIVHERPIGIAQSQRPGVMFNAILLSQVTEFIDTSLLVEIALGKSPVSEVTHEH